MSFTADKQTLDDLNLVGRYKANSIYNLFNKVHTAGGEKLLEEMFRRPLTDARAINDRSMILQYFRRRSPAFPFDGEQIALVEDYLGAGGGNGGNGGSGGRLAATMRVLRKKVTAVLVRDEGYGLLRQRVEAVCAMCVGLARLLDRLGGEDGPYREERSRLLEMVNDSRLKGLGGTDLPLLRLAALDALFSNTLQPMFREMLDAIYRLDVYMAVAGVAEALGLGHAVALPAEDSVLHMAGVRHPGIGKAVRNTVALDGGNNMLFLTGANMAGKSTLMKAFGIAVYLAHMGFPVAAEEMTFSVMDGMYSSINVPDNLALGYSHFYAEVLRVKKVAEAVGEGKRLVVLFDELFKGTNVRDAFDATLAVTEAFAAYRHCWFIISTHIIEVGESLRERCENLFFRYLPTVMEGVVPRYTYRLEEGITADRHGMLIIRNEGILEIIKSS